MRSESHCLYSALSLCLMALALAAPMASAQTDAPDKGMLTSADLSRGRALYGSACDSCHSQNIHWRDKRLAKSWELLVNEVTRWQRNAGRRWEYSEIRDVAAYLNERFYQLPCPPDECVDKQAAARVPERP
jgi:mono/diheme cytochrome c family protein